MNAALPSVSLDLREGVDPHFAKDVLDGLGEQQKTIPCTWLYDRDGSELFDDITRVAAYYPTRAETALLREHLDDLAEALGEEVCLIELGAGSITKTHLVLGALRAPMAYLPIDISADFMLESLAGLRSAFPHLTCIPVIADFTDEEALKNAVALAPTGARKVAFFPGSTIGNFARSDAQRFLSELATALGPDSILAIGVDATSDEATLQLAYDDPEGVTAAFNLNLLARINRELEGDFQLEHFAHEARVNQHEQRVEMHLVSLLDQEVTILGRRHHFAEGETIHTENSHKYGVGRFETMAKASGWHSMSIWRSVDHGFEFHILRTAPNQQGA